MYLLPVLYCLLLYVLIKYDLDRSTMHPKFDPIGIRTHDLQIIHTVLSHMRLYSNISAWKLTVIYAYIT